MANIIPYREFLKRKELREQETGITVSPQQLHPSLFDWQKRLVAWACKVGRAAIWADTGLGKTRMQLEWLRQVCAGHGTGLILAPLAVCQQTIREGAAIGMEVRYVHDQSEVSDGFSITNYERVPKLDVSKFNAVVLDEASILKQSDGKTRKMLIDTFRDTKYRLACTATPAPNDPEELCNQAEFLGYATRVKMLATYFVHDGNIWRLKGHAVKPMMRWMSQWAIALRKPSDMVEDSSLKDTDADRMAKQCGLNFILRRNMLPDKGDYGCSFGLVSNAGRGRFITPLSPWECWMDVGETAAIQYTYLDRENKEVIRLYRLVVDDSKTTTKVYSKTAQREHDRSVVDPNDVSSVAKFASDAKAWEPGSDWEWAEDSQASDFSYAEGCDSLPIVRLSTVDGQGLFEPYLPMLKRIDRETFDRLCITMMQAFRQRAIKGTVPTTYTEEDQEVIDGDKQAGDPIDLASTFAVGPAALWKLPDGVDIWESQTTDTGSLQNNIMADVKQLASAAGIPLDILSPDVQGSANGAELKRETLKFKVQTMNELDSEPIVRMVRMALAASKTANASASEFEMVWKPMDTTSSLEQAQACQLLYQSGLLARRTILTHKMGFTAQDVSEDDMNRLADQFNISGQANKSNAKPVAAVEPATGWDDETQSAVDGLPNVEGELVDEGESES